MELRAAVKDNLDYLIRVRRKLHSLAELSKNEVKTREFLASELTALGFKPKKCSGGLIVDIVPKGADKVNLIGLRADMDALPIVEKRNISFKAEGGAMHACGHDGHMAILLCVAKLLSVSPPTFATRLIFQHGEEGAGGAREMIEAGAAKGLTEIYALHLSPDYDKGTIALNDGAMFAGTTDFEIAFKGRCAHAALPSQGADAIKACMRLLEPLARFNSDELLIHTGIIKGGRARNIIADLCITTHTARYFDEQKLSAIMLNLEEELCQIDASLGTNHSIKVTKRYPALINSKLCYDFIMQAVPSAKSAERLFLGEDFAEFCNVAEGAIAWLGTREEGYNSPLHSDTFGFDESALLFGVEYFLRLLENKGREE